MRYFITGATGFIGGQVARELIELGHDVVALVRDPRQARHLRHLGIELSRGDVTDRASMRAAMTGVDGVFHVAAWARLGTRDARTAHAVNVEGTRNVLGLMRELGIAKGVYTSTVSIHSDTEGLAVDESHRHDGAHLTEYDRTKWQAHYEVALPMMAEGLPLVVVQPGLVYGPTPGNSLQEIIAVYLRRQLPFCPQNSAFSWVHVDDVAHGHVLAMERGRVGESYHLTGPAHTMSEALELAERVTGVPAPRLSVSPEFMQALATMVRWWEVILPWPESFGSERLSALCGATYLGSNAKAVRDLGFHARSLEEGLPETLWYEMQRQGFAMPGFAL